jgi:hypothetical protein
MNQGQTILAQIMSYIPQHSFGSFVNKYQGNYRVRTFTCWEQFLVMAFAQLTYRESLRDIEICLRAMRNKLYHVGIRSNISRSTLADANEKEIVEYMLTWQTFSSMKPKNFIKMKNFSMNLIQLFTLLIQQLSIYAYHFSLGQSFALQKVRLKSILS